MLSNSLGVTSEDSTKRHNVAAITPHNTTRYGVCAKLKNISPVVNQISVIRIILKTFGLLAEHTEY